MWDNGSIWFSVCSESIRQCRPKLEWGFRSLGQSPSAEGGGEAAQSALAGVRGAKLRGKCWLFLQLPWEKCIAKSTMHCKIVSGWILRQLNFTPDFFKFILIIYKMQKIFFVQKYLDLARMWTRPWCGRMQPSVMTKLRLVSSRFFLQFQIFEILYFWSFLTKTIHIAKDADAALMRPDAALRTIQMLLFGLGRVRAARGPHPF